MSLDFITWDNKKTPQDFLSYYIADGLQLRTLNLLQFFIWQFGPWPRCPDAHHACCWGGSSRRLALPCFPQPSSLVSLWRTFGIFPIFLSSPRAAAMDERNHFKTVHPDVADLLLVGITHGHLSGIIWLGKLSHFRLIMTHIWKLHGGGRLPYSNKQHSE